MGAENDGCPTIRGAVNNLGGDGCGMYLIFSAG